MKILFITHYDSMYGANRALLNLLGGIARDGRHEAILVLPAEGELSRSAAAAGIECFICPVTQWQAIYREPLSFALKRARRRAAIAAELELLYAHFKDKGIELIHSNSSVIGTGAMLADKLGCRHIWHIREFSEEHYGMRYFYSRKYVRTLYEKAWRLVTISDALKENYRRRYPEARITRIYDGVEETEPLERRPHEGVTFCYVGYLFPKKRQLELLKAFRMLRDSGKAGFRLVLAGTGDAAYTKILKSYAKRYKLDFVEFAGFVEDVPALLATCDVGVIASEYEGFGLVSVEYMLAGLPVLGRRSGATPEIAVDGETALLYDDETECAQAAERLLRDAELRQRMGEAGRLRARDRFLLKYNTGELLKLYEESAG